MLVKVTSRESQRCFTNAWQQHIRFIFFTGQTSSRWRCGEAHPWMKEPCLSPPPCFPWSSAPTTTTTSSVSIRTKRATTRPTHLLLATGSTWPPRRSRIVVHRRACLLRLLVRAFLPPSHNHNLSWIHGVIVFAAGAYEGKADMNGKSEWMNQGECIRVTTVTGFFMVWERKGEGGAGDRARGREKEKARVQKDRSTAVHPHDVFTNCLISSTNRNRACFSCPRSALSPSPLLLTREYRCMHVARFSRTTTLQ